MILAGSLLVSLLLVFLNGFFVLSEYAIVKVRASRVEELVRRGGRGAALVKHITAHVDAYISATQLGVTMTSLGIGWIGEPAVARLLEPWLRRLPGGLAAVASHSVAFGLAFVFITYIHVVVGEQAPKLVAIRSPLRIARWVAPPLNFFYRLFYLPMCVINGSSQLFLRLTRMRFSSDTEATHSEEELRIILSQSQERGALPLGRLLLFENLFDFSNDTVKDVMTPIASVSYLSLERPWAENLAVIRASKRTRYPLCGKDVTDVKGFVHLKEIVIAGHPAAPDLGALRRDLSSLQETFPLEKALAEMRRNRAYLALVRDKTARITGLISLEDILEELVGEIHDEFESKPASLLSEVLVPEAIELNLPSQDRSRIIGILLRRLIAARPGIDFKEAWESVWRRENTLSSAIGKGVAIPHGRLATLDKPVLVLGRSLDGVDFHAPDKGPARLIFLILTPSKEPGIQIRLLAKVAALASHETFRSNLQRVATTKDVLDILQAFEQGTTD